MWALLSGADDRADRRGNDALLCEGLKPATHTGERERVGLTDDDRRAMLPGGRLGERRHQIRIAGGGELKALFTISGFDHVKAFAGQSVGQSESKSFFVFNEEESSRHDSNRKGAG